ncbi:hypothetical protein D3C76_1800230 [compost metagenome]
MNAGSNVLLLDKVTLRPGLSNFCVIPSERNHQYCDDQHKMLQKDHTATNGHQDVAGFDLFPLTNFNNSECY